MKNLSLKFLSILFLFSFVDNIGAAKVHWADLTPEALEGQKKEALRQLSILAGIALDKECFSSEELEEEKGYDQLTKSRRRVSLSKNDENLETLVKSIVLFSNLDFNKIIKFENKFMETFNDINLAGNALKYMLLAVETHDEILQITKSSMKIDDLPNGFFKLAWRIHFAKKNGKKQLAERRTKIFNSFIAFLCRAADYAPLQLSDDEKGEFADMIAKIKTFNPKVLLN